jgi:nickel-dependent lactate racemase
MNIDLHYGKGTVSIHIPQDNLGPVIRPWQDEGGPDNVTLMRQAMTGEDTERFQDEIEGKRLCVLLDDGTRDNPFGDIFGPLFGALRASSFVRFLICTGTHDPDTSENKSIIEQIIKAAGEKGIGDFEIHAHDCQHDQFLDAGKTSYGTRVLYNVLTDDADVFVTLSDVKVHYFAGYSNSVKNFVPGICAFETAEQNHSLALNETSTFGLHPWHHDENRRANPLAADQLEAMELIVRNRPVYTLTTITTSRQIRWAQFGPVERITGNAFSAVDQKNTHTVTPHERLIVSPGGLPNDIDLYISQRALELTKNAVTDDGEVLFLSACPNGIGEEKTMENFYNRLILPIDEIFKTIEGEYKLYSHKPYKFAQMIRRLRRIWMHSEIPDDLIEAAHLYPTHDPQAIVDGWLAEQPDVEITIVDGANKIALYAEESAH